MSGIAAKYYNDKNGYLRLKEPAADLEIVSEIANKVAAEHDRVLMDMLSKCGFSKEFMLAHREDFYIESFAGDPMRCVYMYKNKPLFMEIEERSPMVGEDDTYAYHVVWKYEMMWDGKED